MLTSGETIFIPIVKNFFFIFVKSIKLIFIPFYLNLQKNYKIWLMLQKTSNEVTKLSRSYDKV